MAENKTTMDEQMDVDRNFFDTHPKVKSYVRAAFDNEKDQCLFCYGRYPEKILVRNLGQGLRVRQFLFNSN